ncbi:MAG: hypothetical protein NWR72_18095 [Bacteroidia bacterium]|nr:hypothetical protein [Bacteroidia bacterium]
MEITQVSTGNLTAEIRVQLTPDDYKQAVTDEIKKQSKKVSVPGFRPGKIPFTLVRKMLGISVVVEEVNRKVTHELVHYIQDNKLNILGEPIPVAMKNEEDFDLECTKVLDFAFEVGLAPDISLDFSKLEIPAKYIIKVDDPFLNKEIDNYVDRFGGVTNPDDAQAGDILYGRGVEVDDAGEVLEGGFDRMMAFNPDRVKNDAFFTPFFGLQVDEKKEFDLFSMSDDAAAIAEILFMEAEEVEALKGKKLAFELKKVNRVGKAEMNPEFFAKVGNAYGWENVEDVQDEVTFRSILAAKIEEELKDSAGYQFRNDLQKTIMENFSIELPDEFLKKWLLKKDEFTEEKLETEYDQFAKSVTWSLIVESVKEKADLDVSEEEVKQAVAASLMKMLGRSGMDANPEMMNQYMEYAMQNQEMVDGEYRKLLDDKLYRYFETELAPASREISATDFVAMIEASKASQEE